MLDQQTTMSVFEDDKNDFNRFKVRYFLKHNLKDIPTDPEFFKIMVRTHKEGD